MQTNSAISFRGTTGTDLVYTDTLGILNRSGMKVYTQTYSRDGRIQSHYINGVQTTSDLGFFAATQETTNHRVKFKPGRYKKNNQNGTQEIKDLKTWTLQELRPPPRKYMLIKDIFLEKISEYSNPATADSRDKIISLLVGTHLLEKDLAITTARVFKLDDLQKLYKVAPCLFTPNKTRSTITITPKCSATTSIPVGSYEIIFKKRSACKTLFYVLEKPNDPKQPYYLRKEATPTYLKASRHYIANYFVPYNKEKDLRKSVRDYGNYPVATIKIDDLEGLVCLIQEVEAMRDDKLKLQAPIFTCWTDHKLSFLSLGTTLPLTQRDFYYLNPSNHLENSSPY
jgi:hypothetical protein